MIDPPPQVPIRRHGLGHVELYDVTGDELDALERECASVGLDFQVASLALAVAASFLASLLLSTPANPTVVTVFVVLVVVGFALSLIFGVRWFRGRSALQVTMQRIRSRPIGPVGSEAHVLKPAELDQLPSEQPTGDAQ